MCGMSLRSASTGRSPELYFPVTNVRRRSRPSLLEPFDLLVSSFAPRKNATFAERKATIGQLILERSLGLSVCLVGHPRRLIETPAIPLVSF